MQIEFAVRSETRSDGETTGCRLRTTSWGRSARKEDVEQFAGDLATDLCGGADKLRCVLDEEASQHW